VGLDELRELLRSRLADITATPDELKRARDLSEELAMLQEAISEYSRSRRETLEGLVSKGVTHQQIADAIKVARARVGQLLQTGPKPERALLGAGELTVACGSKPEAQPKTDTPSDMLSAEMSKAFHIIAKTARAYGLDADQEIVRASGIVNVNRPNLIVMGSPRILPVVTLPLDADDNLGFRECARGFYLVEGDTDYRSPIDRGEPTDYAYIGRLPRPDRKGTFLYLAGIHAMGTLGAAKFLADNVPDLYSVVRNRRWSMLIECRYDPDSRTILSTRPLTKIYH
jgi:hypothetical protein